LSEQNEIIQLAASDEDSGTRLDSFLAANIDGWSRSRLRQLIDDGAVLVNDREVKPSYKVCEGDVIDIELTVRDDARFEPEDIPLDIVFEDDDLAVINKPAGMVVHPGAGVSSGTLANAIAFHFGDPLQKPAREQGRDRTDNRVGIVHRLDKDTSGLIVVAKNFETQEALSAAFRDRAVQKTYVALVHGNPRENSGIIDRPITRDRWHRTKMTVAANGRNALTHWKIRERYDKFTLLDVEIKTGRTHQIRVHLASINHPVVGDATYNEGRDNSIANNEVRKAVERLGRFFLHSAHLAFDHPKTGERLSFSSELPQELAQLKILIGTF